MVRTRTNLEQIEGGREQGLPIRDRNRTSFQFDGRTYRIRDQQVYEVAEEDLGARTSPSPITVADAPLSTRYSTSSHSSTFPSSPLT